MFTLGKRLGVVMLLVACSLAVCGEPAVLFPASDDQGLYGFIDKNGKMIVNPKFRRAEPFSEGFAPVRNDKGNHNWGYVDSTGALVIKMEFDIATPFREGLALVHREDTNPESYQFIDKTGKVTIDKVTPYHTWADTYFSEGLAIVKTGEHYGYIGKDGKPVIQGKYTTCMPFRDGLAAVRGAEEEYMFIDKTGKPVIKGAGEVLFNDIFTGHCEGLAGVALRTGKSTFIDKKGHPIPGEGFAYRKLCAFSEGLAFVEQNGFVNKDGQIVVKGEWQSGKEFSEGLAPVELKDGDLGWGFVDKTGKVVIPPQFDEADCFSNGLARVKAWVPGELEAAMGSRLKDGKEYSKCWVYINREGKIIWQPSAIKK